MEGEAAIAIWMDDGCAIAPLPRLSPMPILGLKILLLHLLMKLDSQLTKLIVMVFVAKKSTFINNWYISR